MTCSLLLRWHRSANIWAKAWRGKRQAAVPCTASHVYCGLCVGRNFSCCACGRAVKTSPEAQCTWTDGHCALCAHGYYMAGSRTGNEDSVAFSCHRHVLFYAYYNDLLQQIDALTELLNRRCFENHLHTLRHNVRIIYLDADRLISPTVKTTLHRRLAKQTR